jgi:DNA recombination protein RmuC
MDFLTVALLVLVALLAVAVLWLARTRTAGVTRDDIDRLERGFRGDLGVARNDQLEQARGLREEVSGTLTNLAELQKTTLDGFSAQVARLGQTVAERLSKLSEDNAAKLEQMRQTVDERLQTTLEKRLTDAFGQVSELLGQVHKGLGEMQSLASGVGDLKRVLTNVKTRGTWGEVQLGNLLEQMFSPEQYEHNFAPREGSPERVEYAVRYPGGGEHPMWLPIDAKYPAEDYERLVLAAERADPEGVEAAGKALETRVRGFAKEVSEKYINPPRTTDYAFLFLPTEGLYAELLRRPGFMESLLRDYHVNLCGPTTLAAMLTGVVYGFRRIAIQQHTREIQDLLGAVKSEFGRFGEALDKVRKKIDEAGSSIDQVSVRRRAIERKLRDVESLPAPGTQRVLDLGTEDDGANDGE